ncbi:hypothetical protein ALI144C_28525 [Actinosynnema sp. ALI-1.44]|uniref:hypothetical protein n=1 Tax=Actinosynnema sp. ALI-1.44 TaxID=1933779 RepID=UPI00097BBA49|nr:hypothetical protein [Actinosynnema sp. ALI-1.44]ONI78734.1 hypothetical protein ALI144C_28525 [Actinosynnema sp. ALI-1.44]
MTDHVRVDVAMIVDCGIRATYTVDELNDEATITLVGTKGFESYIQLDTTALQRIHDITGAALTDLRAHQNGRRP